MTELRRAIAAVMLTAAWTTSFVLAQGGAQAPPAQPQGQPPQGQGPGPAGRGEGGQTADAPARGRVAGPGGGRVGGYTQFTRPLASQDVILRGKAVYETNCA